MLHSSGSDDIMLVSRKGQAMRFHETEARPMGRATSGVKGMRLRKDDEVISATIAQADLDMLVVTDQGYGKRTRIADYPVKGRGGLGVKTVKLTEARGQLAGAVAVSEGDQLMLISTGGTMIRMLVRRSSARTLDSRRDRHAPARGRAGFQHRPGRGARGKRKRRRDSAPATEETAKNE